MRTEMHIVKCKESALRRIPMRMSDYISMAPMIAPPIMPTGPVLIMAIPPMAAPAQEPPDTSPTSCSDSSQTVATSCWLISLKILPPKTSIDAWNITTPLLRYIILPASRNDMTPAGFAHQLQTHICLQALLRGSPHLRDRSLGPLQSPPSSDGCRDISIYP